MEGFASTQLKLNRSNAAATLVEKAQERKDSFKPSISCHVGIHWK